MIRILILLVAAVSGTVQAAGDDDIATPDPAEVLQLASDAGDWLLDNAVAMDNGIAWPTNTLVEPAFTSSLGGGTAGTVVFLSALYKATGEDRYRQAAIEGARYLASSLRDETSIAEGQRRASLYAGVAGIGVALLNIDNIADSANSPDGLQDVYARLVEWQAVSGTGSSWSSEYNDLAFGDAGTTLFLAFAAHLTSNQQLLSLAERGGVFLAGQAQAAPVGHYWLFRRSKDFNLPNFSHGTAGVAYTLMTVGMLTGNNALTDAAVGGFRYLESVADTADGALRFPYGWPLENWEGQFQAGWAHGLSGTANLFYRMRDIGVLAPVGSEYLLRTARSLMHIDPSPGSQQYFSEPSTALDMRFGRAGILAFLGDSVITEVEPDIAGELRLRHWRVIVEAAVRENGRAHWEVDAPEFMGGGRSAYTGFFHGAAGIGWALLKLHATLSGKPHYAILPDDPATWRL